MAHYNELDVVGQNKARQKRLRVLAEIGCILLFILFMLPFFIVLMNSMRTNAEIINQAVGMPTAELMISALVRAEFSSTMKKGSMNSMNSSMQPISASTRRRF